MNLCVCVCACASALHLSIAPDDVTRSKAYGFSFVLMTSQKYMTCGPYRKMN
jgi:hypothetical protein